MDHLDEDPGELHEVGRNLEAEAVWGDGRPSDARMEDIVCQGYFPFLNWEFFLWAYPLIAYDEKTEMFLAAMHRAISKRHIFFEVPPHVENPRVGTKQIGNVITGKRKEYWKVSADEAVSYFRNYWPSADTRGQALSDHQSAHWPLFCFPMSAKEYDPLNKHPDVDWDDCFMFA